MFAGPYTMRNLYAGQEATVRTGHGTTEAVPNRERSTSRLYIVILLIQLICRVHHAKCQTGWSTSWNQDCQEKYQEPQIHRWHHSYGRKQRRIIEPLDKSERGEWKSWLKTQYLREQDGGGVGRCGVHLFPQRHQEYNFRHRSAHRTPAESGQEYLTSGKKYKNHTKLSKTKELGRKIGVLVGLNLDVLIQHQDHKPYCRYGLLNSIALLSLG